MDQLYRCKMKYDEQSVKRLKKVINRTLNLPNEIVRYMVSILMVVLGIYRGGRIGILLVAFGAILFTIGDVLMEWRAAHTSETIENGGMDITFEFLDKEVLSIVNGQTMRSAYRNSIRLVDDGEYLYMFTSPAQAFMVEKSKLKPACADELKQIIAKGAGIEWTKPMSMLTMNLKQIYFNCKNTKSYKQK